MFGRRRNLIRVPRDLSTVTRIDSGAEADPASLGVAEEDIRRIWSSIEHLYRGGTQPFISLGLWRNGQCLIKRSIGHVRGNAPTDPDDGRAVVGTPDTPVCLFSASKAVTAVLIHQLAERGHLSLEAPIAEYLPEFGARGKHRVTVSELLAHRAGIPRIPMRRPDPDILFDWDAAVDLLCRAKPLHHGGKQVAYHAITGGFILGEVARRTTGRELRPLLDELLRTPLGLRYFSYGLDAAHRHELAQDTFTGPVPPKLIGMIAKRALGVPFQTVPSISTDPRFMEAVIPAGNIVATADEMCRFLTMLLQDGAWQGTQVLKPETAQRLRMPVGGRQLDKTLVVPVRFSEGLLLGDSPVGLYGRNSSASFGHLGFINILCWADPKRDLAVSLLTSGKPAVSSHLLQLARVVTAIDRLPMA